MYVQTFLLAAQSLGLGAIPQAALAAYAPFIRDFFGLPHNRLIVCGVSFGWPTTTIRPTASGPVERRLTRPLPGWAEARLVAWYKSADRTMPAVMRSAGAFVGECAACLTIVRYHCPPPDPGC